MSESKKPIIDESVEVARELLTDEAVREKLAVILADWVAALYGKA